MHINPDHYLETPTGRVLTPERNAMAWRQCFVDLAQALRAREKPSRLYVLVGAQGAGKSTWAANQKLADPGCVIFDAILVKRSERKPILDEAVHSGIPAVGVWFQTPLRLCLQRNACRPADQIADERGLRNVFAALEPPAIEEGFSSVLVVLDAA
ncbi:MAG: AAA family ATPase [Burkholderiaceae bacterium]